MNWNRFEDVSKNIDRLHSLGVPNSEIIVVDNGSDDGSAGRLSIRGAIRLIPLGANLGPAAARNLGIAFARGRYLFFIDSDALIGRRGLARVLDRMEADPTLGIVGCRIVNARTRKLDQWIYAEAPETHEHVEFETYSFSAAGAVARADAVRKAGCFWDEMFIYNEEVDLSIRVLRSGFRIIYLPDVKVFHFGAERGRVGSRAYWYYQIRNWIWIFYRYYPFAARVRMIAAYTLIYLVKSALAFRLLACLSGIFAGLRRTDIISSFDDKLSGPELLQMEALNRRLTFRRFLSSYLMPHFARLRSPVHVHAPRRGASIS